MRGFSLFTDTVFTANAVRGLLDAAFCLCLIRQRQEISPPTKLHTNTPDSEREGIREPLQMRMANLYIRWFWWYADLRGGRSCVNTLCRDTERMSLWPRQIAEKKIRKGRRTWAAGGFL